MASSSAYKDSLTQAILDLPLHKTLGIRLISQSLQEATSLPSASLSTARIAISSAPLHLSLVGTLHGGISTLLIDIACLLAMVPTLADGQSAATLSSSFQMLNAVVVPAEVGFFSLTLSSAGPASLIS